MDALPQSVLNTEAGEVVLTWLDCQTRMEMDQYQPCTQVYGICFDNHGGILVIDEKGTGAWKIAGGTPEEGETPEQTLIRELLEEADVELAELLPVGVQKVEELFPDKDHPKVYYQWRFAGKIAKLHPQTPDPDTGRIYQRKFVSTTEINKMVKWGEIGRAMFVAAIRVIRHG